MGPADMPPGGARTGRWSLPSRRTSARILLTAALLGLICWYFGLDAWHSVLLGCAIVVAALAINFAASAADATVHIGWRPRERLGNDGSRKDVSSLSWSLRGGWGLVGPTAELRVRHIARHRLALEGLDLRNPAHRDAIERRIGTRLYRVLKPGSTRRLRTRTLVRCMDALDNLNTTYYPPPTSRRSPPPPRRRPQATRTVPTSPREDP